MLSALMEVCICKATKYSMVAHMSMGPLRRRGARERLLDAFCVQCHPAADDSCLRPIHVIKGSDRRRLLAFARCRRLSCGTGEDLEERFEVPRHLGQGLPWTRHERCGAGEVQDQPPREYMILTHPHRVGL